VVCSRGCFCGPFLLEIGASGGVGDAQAGDVVEIVFVPVLSDFLGRLLVQ